MPADLGATDVLTAVGSAGGNVRLVSYGSLHGTIAAGGDLAAWSLGTINADLSAEHAITRVVTYDSLLGSLTAEEIRGVYVWDDLDAVLTASDFLGEVYVGDEID